MLKPSTPARCGLQILVAALAVCPAVAAPASSQASPARLHHTRRHHHALAAAPSAGPEAPAAQPANTTTAAPVPDEAVTPPVDNPSPSANLAPSVFQLHYPPQGDGYVTGSSPQAMDDRNAAKATGMQATVPLPQ